MEFMTQIKPKILKINNSKYIKINTYILESNDDESGTHIYNNRLYRIIENEYKEGIFTYYYAAKNFRERWVKYTGGMMNSNKMWILHREDGPAVENEDKTIQSFYLEDFFYQKEEYFNKLTSKQKYDALWNL